MTVLKTLEYLLVRNLLSSALWIRIFSVNCNVCFSSLGSLSTYILPYLDLNTPRYLEFCNVCWCQQAEIHPVEVCSLLLLFFPNGRSGYCNALENLKLHTAIFFKVTNTRKGATAGYMFDWLDNLSKLYQIHRLCNVDCVGRDSKSTSPNKNEEPYWYNCLSAVNMPVRWRILSSFSCFIVHTLKTPVLYMRKTWMHTQFIFLAHSVCNWQTLTL